jgi:protease PrsW
MDVILLALTVAPGLAIALFIYLKDRYDREPFRQLIWAFLLGVCSTIPAAALSYSFAGVPGLQGGESEKATFTYAFITVALAEEGSKFFFLRLFYRKPFFDEPFDGITYAVMISMGFATLENLLYVFGSGMGSYSTALLRMLTAVPAHASFAVIMGYFVGMAKFKPHNRTLYLLLGLLGAIFFHGTYDFLLMLRNYPYIAYGAMVSLGVSLFLSFKAIKVHQNNSPFKKPTVW